MTFGRGYRSKASAERPKRSRSSRSYCAEFNAVMSIYWRPIERFRSWMHRPCLSPIRTRTRAVYRKSVEDIYNMLITIDGPTASADRARLSTLGTQVKHLAITRPLYDNIRANIVYAHLDSRGRGRVQMAAELLLIYAMGRRQIPPQVRYPAPLDENDNWPRRVRKSNLEPEPFLRSIPVHRYVRNSARK
jgi:hypothetical protein